MPMTVVSSVSQALLCDFCCACAFAGVCAMPVPALVYMPVLIPVPVSVPVPVTRKEGENSATPSSHY
jgi:hypothetical protein